MAIFREIPTVANDRADVPAAGWDMLFGDEIGEVSQARGAREGANLEVAQPFEFEALEPRILLSGDGVMPLPDTVSDEKDETQIEVPASLEDSSGDRDIRGTAADDDPFRYVPEADDTFGEVTNSADETAAPVANSEDETAAETVAEPVLELPREDIYSAADEATLDLGTTTFELANQLLTEQMTTTLLGANAPPVNELQASYSQVSDDFSVIDDAAPDSLRSVSGTISTDTTWDSTIEITGDVIFTSSATLTIEPGTVIKFQPGTFLFIQGNIAAKRHLCRADHFHLRPRRLRRRRPHTRRGDHRDGRRLGFALPRWHRLALLCRGPVRRGF